ncbi:MAG: PadR family transcriptional regulator [Candidatus Hydrogenedentota bacterium]
MNFDKELLGASTRILVLTVLAKKSSYGYEIIKEVNTEADGTFVWQEGTMYPVLHKLEKEGLVRSQWQESEVGRRRKYYYITAKGREALAEGSERWSTLHGMMLRLAEDTHG